MLQHAVAAQHVHRARDHEARRARRRCAELKVCVAYEGDDGTRYDHVPYHQSVLHKVRPIYETLPGWGVEIDRAERLEDLPRDGARLRAVHRGVRRRARELRVGRARRATRASCCPAPPDVPRDASMRVLVVGSGGREHALAWPRSAAAQRRRRGRLRARQSRDGRRSASACRSTSAIAGGGRDARRRARRRPRRRRPRGPARRGRRRRAAGARVASRSGRVPRRRGSRARRRG